MRAETPPRSVRNCGLHPLIHTFPPEVSVQDVENKKAQAKTPHFLSLKQDIVAGSQEKKCELKYVIYIQGRHKKAEPKLRSVFWEMIS